MVAYDIRSDRRRRKVLATLKNYGVPVQLSVVECELDTARLARMKQEVRQLINPRSDRVRVYWLCERCFLLTEAFGAATPPTEKL